MYLTKLIINSSHTDHVIANREVIDTSYFYQRSNSSKEKRGSSLREPRKNRDPVNQCSQDPLSFSSLRDRSCSDPRIISYPLPPPPPPFYNGK